MILTDREIQAAIGSGQIVIDPAPNPESYSSTSVDLTLDASVSVWKKESAPGVEPPVISPGVTGFSFANLLRNHLNTQKVGVEGYILEPGEFILAWTRERVMLPVSGRLAARVEGKSSLARCGVGVHITAPTIHAGFDGQVQLEMYNHSSLRMKLLPGMKVCQLIFEMALGTPEKGYKGIFAGQTSKS